MTDIGPGRRTDFDLAALRRAVVAERPDLDTLAALVRRVGARPVRPALLLEKAEAILAARTTEPQRQPSPAAEPWTPAEPKAIRRRRPPGKNGDPRADRAVSGASRDGS